MSFEVHPGPGAGPPSVPAGTSSSVAVSEHAAVDPVTGRNMMFLRVVQVGEGDARVGPPPSILLAAGAGPATEVGAAATPIAQTHGGAAVAIATLSPEPDDVQLVEVELLLPTNLPWRIHLRNHDSVSRRYVLVVGSTSPETRKPWLDVVTRSLAFDVLTGATSPAKEATIANYGSGPLSMTDADGTELGLGFRLLAVTPRPIGANRRAVARIAFTAGATPGSPTTTRAFGSDDPAAGDTAGHDGRVTLTAIVRPRPGLLEIVQGGPLGTRFTLDRPVTTVGRDSANDVVFDDTTVSPRHAELRLEQGKFEIVDLGSLNGVFVNKQKVGRAVLATGDVIQLGKVRLKFSIQE